MFIVLGLITEVGTQVARVVGADRTTNSLNVKTAAVSEWNNAFTTLKTNMSQNSTANCGQSLTCYTTADSQLAVSLTSFANEVQAITMPPAAAPDATTVVAEARKAAQDFTELSHVTDLGLYQGTYSGTGVNQELQRFSQDVDNCATALSNA